MVHRTDTILTGAAGEHLVLSRLLQRGVIAAQAPEGVRKVDILVNSLEGGEPCFLQVKSRQFGSDGGWHMSQKHESISEPNIFYCFVDFEPEHALVYVIPSDVVATVLRDDHQIWLDTPGKHGQAHNPTKMRRLTPISAALGKGWLEPYVESWDQVIRRDL